MRRTRLLDSLVVVLGVTLALGLGEILLRAFWPQRSDVSVGMFRPDPHAGYSLRPEYRNDVRLPEYRTTIRTDSEGYRVTESEAPAGPDEPRVLVIGDSFTFGVGVNAEDALPHRLEAELAAGGERCTVRNGGVGGYGPLRSARLLTGHQGAWPPDLVVHVLYAGNDVVDPRPNTYLENPQVREGRLVSPGRHPLMRARLALRTGSHLYAFLRERLYGLYCATPLADRSQYLEPVGLREWPARVEEISWPAGRAAIAEIRDWCHERNVGYLVVLAPARWQVDDDAWDRYCRAWGRPAEEFDRERAMREMAEAVDGLGVEVVDLLPEFRDQQTAGAPLYYGHDPHWTPEGHSLAARSLARALLAGDWLMAAERRGRAVAGVVAPDEAG